MAIRGGEFMNKTKKELEKIWEQMPVDYYHVGVRKNILQKIWHQGKLEAALSLLEELDWLSRQRLKLLDVGCASGWFLSAISSRQPQFQCFGVDVYQKAIDYGQKLHPQISFKQADAHKLPFRQKSFDLVICTEVLEHTVNPEKVLKELKRVTKKNGAVIVSLDSGNLLFNLAWSFWKKFKGKIWQNAHLHQFKPADLDKLFLKAGFRIEKKKFFNFTMALVYLLRVK